MANITKHATIRRTQKNYIISIVKNYIRIQRTYHIDKCDDEMAKGYARELEEQVSKAPERGKFETAKYLMSIGGLPYMACYLTKLTDFPDDYRNWVMAETRQRLVGFTW